MTVESDRGPRRAALALHSVLGVTFALSYGRRYGGVFRYHTSYHCGAWGWCIDAEREIVKAISPMTKELRH